MNMLCLTALSLMLWCGNAAAQTVPSPSDSALIALPDSVSADQERTRQILERLLGDIARDVAADSAQQETNEPELEIDGLVLNETKTKLGQDFYDEFYTNWEAPPGVSNFTVYINERPIGGMGSLISVRINETDVFANRLTPRAEVIEQHAANAVALCSQYLIARQDDENQLSGQDTRGTGIY